MNSTDMSMPLSAATFAASSPHAVLELRLALLVGELDDHEVAAVAVLGVAVGDELASQVLLQLRAVGELDLDEGPHRYASRQLEVDRAASGVGLAAQVDVAVGAGVSCGGVELSRPGFRAVGVSGWWP